METIRVNDISVLTDMQNAEDIDILKSWLPGHPHAPCIQLQAHIMGGEGQRDLILPGSLAF